MTKQDTSKNFYLTIYIHIDQRQNINELPLILGITKQKLNYYISHLKRAYLVRKLGYGTWETINNFSYDLEYEYFNNCRSSR